MSYGYVEDSNRHCPRCRQRMRLEIGPNEDTGECELVHACWGCRLFERDEVWLVDVRRQTRRAARMDLDVAAAALADPPDRVGWLREMRMR